MMLESEDREWMDAPMGPITDAVPSLEEVKDSLPAELTVQRKALEAHIQAWFLERQEANFRAIDRLRAENACLQARVKELETEVGMLRDTRDSYDIARYDFERLYRKTKRERDRYQAEAERRGEALKPFALFHQARVQAAPRIAAKDSSIPVLSYGKVYLGDKHFREADAALAPEEEGQ